MAGNIFRNITFWVFTAGVAGYLLAWLAGDPAWTSMADAPVFYEFIQLLKTTFLALLKMLVAPIIFFSLIGGLLHIGDATRLRQICQDQAGLTLGIGLGDFVDRGFRIGHMGHLNPPMVLGALATAEAALHTLDAPVGGSGVAAAAKVIGEAFDA